MRETDIRCILRHYQGDIINADKKAVWEEAKLEQICIRVPRS